MLLELDLFGDGVLEEALHAEGLHTVVLLRLLAQRATLEPLGSNALPVVRDHVALLDDVELVNEFFQGASASSDRLLEGQLGDSALAALVLAAGRHVVHVDGR